MIAYVVSDRHGIPSGLARQAWMSMLEVPDPLPAHGTPEHLFSAGRAVPVAADLVHRVDRPDILGLVCLGGRGSFLRACA